MSLSAAEKVRVVQALDLARRPLHRGRLSQLEPEGGRALPAARRGRARERPDLRLRHDPQARGRGRGRSGAQGAGRVPGAGLHPGRQDLGASPGQGDQGLARGEPRHDHGLDLLPEGPRQARRIRRGALLRRLAGGLRLRARLPAGGGCRRAPRTSPSATRTAPACRRRWPRRPPRSWQALGDRSGGRHPYAQRRGVRGRQLARRRGRRRAAGAGDDERLRGAEREREPGLDPSRAAAEDGLRLRAPGSPAAADRDVALRRRALQPVAGPRSARTSVAMPSPTRAACTWPG